MREVLESPQVTKSIHYWIDLIFGYKNPYEVAEQHDNLFHFRTYEHDIFETETTDHEIESAQITISEFGQIPYPLFTSQHPAKKQRGIIALDNHIVIKKKSDKTIKEFVVDKRGIFLASDGDVEFLMSNLDTVETVSGKVYADGEKGPTKLISFSENLWARLCDGTLSIWKKKVCINRTKLQADVFSTMYQYIIYNYKSELRISKFEQTGQLKLIKCLYGHLNLIKIIEVNQTLDLIVSVDTDGLVLVHEFYTGKLQRQFQIGTTKVCQVCIHQMGYFIFFTTEQRIIVYTFLGEVLLDQYINLPVRPHHPEKIITIAIFSQNQSQLLLGTSLNNIFMINFLILRRFSICYPYKTFSRIKNNILKNCVQFSKGSGFFQIQPIIVPGQPPTHKIYVLNGDGTFGCFYQSQLLGKRLKETKTLGALGLFSKQ